jgi:hypothetical protein
MTQQGSKLEEDEISLRTKVGHVTWSALARGRRSSSTCLVTMRGRHPSIDASRTGKEKLSHAVY